jgi:hypothetical protein
VSALFLVTTVVIARIFVIGLFTGNVPLGRTLFAHLGLVLVRILLLISIVLTAGSGGRAAATTTTTTGIPILTPSI